MPGRDPIRELEDATIDDLHELRDRLAHLAAVQETAPACAEDWGALPRRVLERSAGSDPHAAPVQRGTDGW